MARSFAALESKEPPGWFATSDPPRSKLGSGGGTAHLLAEAWRATGPGQPFDVWLQSSRKLVIHSGGQSRRLPCYAPIGKVLMPLPVFRWSRGQRMSQTLLEAQLPAYERVLTHAGSKTALMITSGDVLLRFARQLPVFPDVDVLGLGMWVTPEKARDFGVFFSPRHHPQELAFFLQKPDPARIRQEAGEHVPLVDTGMWLLSERAVTVLMEKCGWRAAQQSFANGQPASYELYSQFGLSLGSKPTAPDPDISRLTSAVLPLPEAEFYHFGTSRQMIESVSALQNVELDETKLGRVGSRAHPDQFLQNAHFPSPPGRELNRTLWVENSVVPATWKLASEHVLTGVPENTWDLQLERGVCLDFVPVGQRHWCVRAYGIDDTFAGQIDRNETPWFGRPAADWFKRRGLDLRKAGIGCGSDIQSGPLFPVLSEQELNPRFIEWLFAEHPVQNEAFARQWLATPRLSAADLQTEVDLARLHAQRIRLRRACLVPLLRNGRWSIFYRLDLEDTAKEFVAGGLSLVEAELDSDDEPLHFVHDAMFRAAVLRKHQQAGWEAHEARAFTLLRDLILREAQLSPARPAAQLQDDQILWARSPVRLDLAGGWTDTPPYCLEHGGRVLNLAVNLNGQPPIQVFAKGCARPELVIRSIDLGVEQRIRTYEDLDTFAQPGSEFALAKAAFALAGFLPRFHADGGFPTLKAQLEALGTGIELSLLAAVPKGSGLGTSSILASTALAALAGACGLGWDRMALFQRTLALEQMLTTGGGWQDQAGALYGGIKLIETEPGLVQKPNVRWLPATSFGPSQANTTILLYYTGLTRLAKSILQEIVRGIFLNSPSHLAIIGDISEAAEHGFQALQRCDHHGLVEAVRASWTLNQALDPGTNPPEVQAIVSRVERWLDACKLLGAGGGGFLLMFAKDAEAAGRIRLELQSNPPNPRARFVELGLSESGLELTRS
jgi:galactokinase/mevalonate kinase-like predicted kinase